MKTLCLLALVPSVKYFIVILNILDVLVIFFAAVSYAYKKK